MVSDAQKRATAKYRRENVRQLVVRFYPKDAELYDFIRERGGSAYLKGLADRERLAERIDDGPLPLA